MKWYPISSKPEYVPSDNLLPNTLSSMHVSILSYTCHNWQYWLSNLCRNVSRLFAMKLYLLVYMGCRKAQGKQKIICQKFAMSLDSPNGIWTNTFVNTQSSWLKSGYQPHYMNFSVLRTSLLQGFRKWSTCWSQQIIALRNLCSEA